MADIVQITHALAELLNAQEPQGEARLVRATADVEGLDDPEYLAGMFGGFADAMAGALPATVWTEHPGDGVVIFCAQTVGGSSDAGGTAIH